MNINHMLLTGLLVPGTEAEPVFLELDGSPDLFLPVFTSEAKLAAAMRQFGIEWSGFKAIADGPRFWREFPRACEDGTKIVVVVDPHKSGPGEVSYTRVLED